jgi:F1F0 ATPase subunit 2
MIIDTNLPYALGLLLGAALGLFYCGGLWLTVKKISVTGNPHRFLLWSAVFRLGCTFLVLFFAARSNILIFILMLIGFLGVRYFVVRRVANVSRRQNHAA